MASITTADALRALYGPANPRSVMKQLDHLDKYARRIIELSPFALLASFGADGLADVTPRGDRPGFVAVEDDRTLILPDRPGNNRIDTLLNIVAHPGVGLLFLVPGVDETLRVNGRASIRDDADLTARFAVDGRVPKSVVVVAVEEVYLHCAKALMRSRLWDPAVQVERSVLPSMGQMLKEQVGWATAETQEEMVERYRKTMY